jgi:hypothetical protein
MLPRLLFVATSTLLMLALAVGCDESPPKKVESRVITSKSTQEVRNLTPVLAKGGQVADVKAPATNYITLRPDANKTGIVGSAQMKVQIEIDMYEKAKGEKLNTYEEFMEKIIKKGRPDGIQLPVLPDYQEYGYDPDTRELVIMEYPEKKKAGAKQ